MARGEHVQDGQPRRGEIEIALHVAKRLQGEYQAEPRLAARPTAAARRGPGQCVASVPQSSGISHSNAPVTRRRSCPQANAHRHPADRVAGARTLHDETRSWPAGRLGCCLSGRPYQPQVKIERRSPAPGFGPADRRRAANGIVRGNPLEWHRPSGPRCAETRRSRVPARLPTIALVRPAPCSPGMSRSSRPLRCWSA